MRHAIAPATSARPAALRVPRVQAGRPAPVRNVRAHGFFDDLKKTMEDAVKKVSSAADDAVKEAEKAASSATEAAEAPAAAAKESVKEAVEEAKEAVKDAEEEVKK